MAKSSTFWNFAWTAGTVGASSVVRFGLNVENIFDATYYESSNNAFRVYPGAPRRFTGTLSVRF